MHASKQVKQRASEIYKAMENFKKTNSPPDC